MDDNGLDWEWTRTEFRKALLDCANAANDVALSEGEGLFWASRMFPAHAQFSAPTVVEATEGPL